MLDDINLHEWAEFNLPAELRGRNVVVSPFARRVLAPSDPVSTASSSEDPQPAQPRLGMLLLPGLGLRPLPKS